MSEEQAVEFLVRNSPPGSGPLYLFLAENWHLVSFVGQVVLASVVVFCMSFAAGVLLNLSDE